METIMLTNSQKSLLMGIVLLFSVHSAHSQDNMGIGTANPNPKSILELSASDKGFLMPRVTTSQRLSINPAPGADEGLMVYDQTDSLFYYWDATQWVPINQGQSGPDGDWTIDGNDIYNKVSGNVGIGTTTPSAKFHTNGSLRFGGLTSSSQNDVLVVNSNGDVSYRTLGSDIWDGDDNNYVDGISVTGGTNKTITLTRTGSLGSLNASLSIDDADADSTNELNTDLDLNGNTLELTDAGGTLTQDLTGIDTDDQDIQGSVLSANNVLTIGIENGANETVDLSTLNQPNTDNQDLGSNTLAGTVEQITITNGNNTTIDVADNDNDSTNEYNTNVNLDNTTLEITDNGGTLSQDLSALQSGSQDADADSTNELQDLTSSKSGKNVTVDITDGNSTFFNVTDSDSNVTNELQNLTMVQNNDTVNWKLSNGGGSGSFATGTDADNYADGLSVTGGTNKTITISRTGSLSDLTSSLSVADNDNDPTNEYNTNVSLNNNTLTISDNGGTLSQDLSSINTDDQAVFQNIQNAAGNTQFSAGNAGDDLQFQGQNGASVSFDPASNKIVIDADNAGDDWGTDDVNSDGTLTGNGAGTQLGVDWSAANDLDNNGNVSLATLSGGDGINGANYNGSSSTTWSVDWSDANDLDSDGNVDELWNEVGIGGNDIYYQAGDVRIGSNTFTNQQLHVEGKVFSEVKSAWTTASVKGIYMRRRPNWGELKSQDASNDPAELKLTASRIGVVAQPPYDSARFQVKEDAQTTAAYFKGEDVTNASNGNTSKWESTVQIEDDEGDMMYIDGDEIDAGIAGDAIDDALYLQNNNNNDVEMVRGGGNAGIGTANPSEKLEVGGNVYASGGDFITSSANGVINAGGGKMDASMNVISDGNVNNQLASGDEDLYINEHLEVDEDFRLEGAFQDNNGNTGSSGDVLTSTGGGVAWEKRSVQYEQVYQGNSSGTVWQHPNNISVNWNGSGQITVANNSGQLINVSIKKIEEGTSSTVNVKGKTESVSDGNSLSMNASVDHSYKILVTDYGAQTYGFQMDVHGWDADWVNGIVKYWN